MNSFDRREEFVGDNQLIRVVVIGSGNVAEAFARILAQTPNVELRQVMARNAERCEQVAGVSVPDSGRPFPEAVSGETLGTWSLQGGYPPLGAHQPERP